MTSTGYETQSRQPNEMTYDEFQDRMDVLSLQATMGGESDESIARVFDAQDRIEQLTVEHFGFSALYTLVVADRRERSA